MSSASTAAAPPEVTNPGDLRTLARSWDRSLRVTHSANTRAVYAESVKQLGEFLVDTGMATLVASIGREHVETWLAHLADEGSVDRE